MIHSVNNTPLRLPVTAISRHRLATDGIGVTTLVGSYGCPLTCRYCINPHAWNPETLPKCRQMTPEDLYEQVKIDNLYFLATGGGITFGGGESLLHADFIHAFREVCGREWRLAVESSLNIPTNQLLTAIDAVDDFIVDIKDMNPDIYQAYTGQKNDQVLTNLAVLRDKVSPDHIVIRVPCIPEFNTPEDVSSSVQILTEMGFSTIDVFPYVLGDHR